MENLSDDLNELKLTCINIRCNKCLLNLFRHQLYRYTGVTCKNSKDCLRELHALITRNSEDFQTLKNEYQQKLLRQEGALDTPVLCSLLNLPCFYIKDEHVTSIERAINILKSFRGDYAHLGDRVKDFMEGNFSNKKNHVFFGCDFECVFEKLNDSVQCIYGYLKREKSVVIDSDKIGEFLMEFIGLKDCHFVIRGESKLEVQLSLYVENKSRKDITQSKKKTIDNVGKLLVDCFPQIIESFYGDCNVQSVTTPEQRTVFTRYRYFMKVTLVPGRNELLRSAKHLLKLNNRYSNEAIEFGNHIRRKLPKSMNMNVRICEFDHWEIIL